MPYIDLAGLSRFDAAQKDALARAYAPLRDMQWTRSEKAGAVSLWPAPSTPLEPVVDFLFAETPPASGDKGPENPSTITGVSSVTTGRVGKNLLFAVADKDNWYGISIVRQADGSYLLNGTSNYSYQAYLPLTDCGNLSSGPYSIIKLNTSKEYTLSAKVVSGSISGGVAVSALSKASINWITGGSMPLTNGATVTATRSASSLVTGEFVCRLNVDSGSSFNNVVLKIQLEEGSTATDFEAPMLPADANHDIPLGNTYYGGTLDVASGVMTVTSLADNVSSFAAVYQKYTNTVAFRTYSTYPHATNFTDYPFGCNRFEFIGTNADEEHWRVAGGGNGDYTLFYINKTRLDISGAVDPENPTDSEWLAVANAWLANNPIVFVYGVSTPQTVFLTPTEILSLVQADKYTPRLNTVYTDAQAVQVGYIKSPIREEQELTQAVAAQGGNV